MKKVKDWSAHIITHFWHCSSACRKDETTSDEEALKTMKVCLFFYHQKSYFYVVFLPTCRIVKLEFFTVILYRICGLVYSITSAMSMNG